MAIRQVHRQLGRPAGNAPDAAEDLPGLCRQRAGAGRGHDRPRAPLSGGADRPRWRLGPDGDHVERAVRWDRAGLFSVRDRHGGGFARVSVDCGYDVDPQLAVFGAAGEVWQ
uniref:(northern house mosquito) hypothetical protein n=1 Tax=Culex pipiens TaxID=7175 RepID=A0A8D8DCI1_CULPI